MASIQIKVPDWLDWICAWPAMRYRKRKYGYAYRRIYVGEGRYTIVDPQDFCRFNNFRWIINGNGKNIYAVRNVLLANGKRMLLRMHREIVRPRRKLLVDHRNGDGLDNRRANLRPATHSQNMQNRGKWRCKASSRFVGVCFDKEHKRWRAYIRCQGKRIYLGRYDNEIVAAKKYDAAAKKYYGEFARLNFPRGN